MLKNIITTSLVVSTLIFSGCETDSEGESRLETQNMLDSGNFIGVINKLEDKASTNEEYLMLANAYMGKAGFSLLEVATNMSKSDNDDMITILADSAKYNSTLDLEKAEQYYKKVVGKDTCDLNNNETLDASQKDVCLFIGLAASTKTASTLNLLVGDMDVFSEDSGVVDYQLDASACAMQFAFDNNMSKTTLKDCEIVVKDDVNFTTINKIYKAIDVVVKADDIKTKYEFLLTDEDKLTHTRSTVLTSGYCTNESFTPRYDEKNISIENLYVCPINEDADVNDTTTTDVLLDALNGGLDSITAAVPDGEDNDDIQNSVDEFKCDVLIGEWNEDTNECTDSTGTTINVNENYIDEQQLIDYLNSQNED